MTQSEKDVLFSKTDLVSESILKTVAAKSNDNNHSAAENVHSAASPKQCREMEKKYGWPLKDIRPNPDPILKVDYVFYGEQTSFQEMWGDYQD